MQELNDIEDEIEVIKRRVNQDDDIPLWRKSDDKSFLHEDNMVVFAPSSTSM